MEGNILEEIMDITKLKVPDLKKELKARGLSTSGNKNELMERLQSALKVKIDDNVSAESVDDLDEDLLNDDELDHEHMDGNESVLTDLDVHLDVNVTPTNKQQQEQKNGQQSLNSKQSDRKQENSIQSQEKPKKVVLKRNSSALEESLLDEKSPNEVKEEKERKILKFSELTMKERLEMRAKKFGVSLSEEAKKTARAQRFGLLTSTPTSRNTSTSGQSDVTSLEALKKRADRFGGSVSTIMSKLEMQERLEKRKQRFGVVTTINGSTPQSEKAKQRLERFKMPIT